jgi:hypothetical protein
LNGANTTSAQQEKAAEAERNMRQRLSVKLEAEKVTAQTSATLRGLEHKLPAGADKEFLKEMIDCFEAGANRATIVLAWILAMDHLFAYMLPHKLTEYNAALALNTDNSVNSLGILAATRWEIAG